jgi:hypothetical protein
VPAGFAARVTPSEFCSAWDFFNASRMYDTPNSVRLGQVN